MKHSIKLLLFLIVAASLVQVVSAERVVIPVQSQVVAQGAVLNLGFIISRVLQAMITLGFVAFFFYFVRSAYLWLSAGGDKAKVEEARAGITQGLIGVALLASVFVIFGIVSDFFGLRVKIGESGADSTGGEIPFEYVGAGDCPIGFQNVCGSCLSGYCTPVDSSGYCNDLVSQYCGEEPCYITGTCEP